jgi:16S rRNA (guanine966-N2)-methyltransferase
MRITGGIHRSRILKSPDGDGVRPTSDKVRQAVFNILLKYGLPEEAQVMDVFCGTGALGLDALSRGAAHCVFIDKSRESLACCRANVEALKLQDQAALLHKNASTLGPKPDSISPAQLVFLDPPYRKNLLMPALTALAEGGWAAPGAICVAECEKEAQAGAPDGFELLETRPYGETQILIARYNPRR